MEYALETERAIKEIKKRKAKIVCLQFPEGLKPRALEVADEIEGRTNAKCAIWLGSCYGACDIPGIDADLLVQFGHSRWNYGKL